MPLCSAGLNVGVLLAAQEGGQALIPGPELPGRFLAWVTLQEMMSHAAWAPPAAVLPPCATEHRAHLPGSVGSKYKENSK